MRRDRDDFQSELAWYRNEYVEHRAEDPSAYASLVADFHRPESAANMFENVWQAMEDYVALYSIANLPDGIHLVEIPESERDPTMPKRFQWAIEGLPTSD